MAKLGYYTIEQSMLLPISMDSKELRQTLPKVASNPYDEINLEC